MLHGKRSIEKGNTEWQKVIFITFNTENDQLIETYNVINLAHQMQMQILILL